MPEHNDSKWAIDIIVTICIIFCGMFFLALLLDALDLATTQASITIQAKDEFNESSSFGTKITHYVVDTDGNAYEVNSPSLYLLIEPGKTYMVTIAGREIVSAQPVNR